MNPASKFPRRRFLTSMAAVTAGVELLREHVSAEDNPAAQVADKASGIRIRSLQTFPAGSKIYIKIETNYGIHGWGEVEQLEPNAALALIRAVYDMLHDENPTRIEHLWQKIYRAHRDIRGGAFMVHTISGIDMALWDITGKLYGVPVYRLLGGPTRDKLRVYPTPKAQKVGCGPSEWSGNPTDIERYVNMVASARKNVGPDGTVMFDAHCALPPPILIQVASALEPHQVLFIEEPAVPGNIEVFKRLKQSIRVPMATGERDRGIWEVIPYLQERCIDILQPDCAHGGGISQVKKIATLGEAFFVPIAPHCVASELGVAASFHAAASVPMFLIHEYYPHIMRAPIVRPSWTVDAEGYASLPQGPGLGVEIDEKVLVDYPKQNQQRWAWPDRGRMKDGSISDY